MFDGLKSSRVYQSGVYYTEERVTLFDVIAWGMGRNCGVTLCFLLNSLAWFGGACAFGVWAQVTWEDNHDTSKFDLPMWIICGVCLFYLFVSMHCPSIMGMRPTGPFRRATYAIVVPRTKDDPDRKCNYKFTIGPHGTSIPRICAWLLSMVTCMARVDDTEIDTVSKLAEERAEGTPHKGPFIVRNRTRSVVYTMHMIGIVLVLASWTILGWDDSGPNAINARFKAHMETFNMMAMLWVLVVPTFSSGVVDGIQLSTSGAASDGRVWLRGLFAFYALAVKFFAVGVDTTLLDPAASFFWPIEKNSDTKIAIMWAAAMILLIATICFWTSYDCLHVDKDNRTKTPEKVFAFVEYPAFLALALKLSWQFNAQLRNQHADVATQAVGGNFIFLAGFVILTTISILNLPSHIDYVEDVAVVEGVLHKEKTSDAESTGLVTGLPVRGAFVKDVKDDDENQKV